MGHAHRGDVERLTAWTYTCEEALVSGVRQCSCMIFIEYISEPRTSRYGKLIRRSQLQPVTADFVQLDFE